MKERGKARTTTLPKRRKLDAREVKQSTIFASLMSLNSDGILKQEKGSRLPVKVDVSWGTYKLKEAVFEKFQRYNKNVEGKQKSDYKLVYKNGDTIRFIFGTDVDFTIKGYKDDLGVGYSSVVVYLMDYDDKLAEDELPDASRYFSNLLPI